jgi:hypothetical protein
MMMSKKTMIKIAIFSALACTNVLPGFTSINSTETLLAQGSSSMGGSTTQGGSTIQQMPPLEPMKPGAPKIKAPPINLPTPAVANPVPVVATYLHPGILVFHDGQWQGSDHLLNLANNIGIYVTIIKPENADLKVNQEQVTKVVADVFNQVNIKPQTLAAPGQPPLPAFEIQILAYPIEKGFTVAIDGRLFESVQPLRFHLDQGMAFQAVTWEKKSLQVGPESTINEQILKSVQDIAIEFADRFKAYADIRKDSTK